MRAMLHDDDDDRRNDGQGECSGFGEGFVDERAVRGDGGKREQHRDGHERSLRSETRKDEVSGEDRAEDRADCVGDREPSDA
jgi:hypothetical protein